MSLPTHYDGVEIVSWLGNKAFAVCPDYRCQKVVQVNKRILGAVHFCTGVAIDNEMERQRLEIEKEFETMRKKAGL